MMEHVTLTDIASLALGIVFLLIRNHSTKIAKEEVQSTVNSKGNETVIKLGNESDLIMAEINAVSKRVENAINLTVSERAAHSAALEEVRSSNNLLAFNLKRVVAHAGLEWKDEVSLVPEPKRLKE